MDLISEIMNGYSKSKGASRKIAQYLLRDPQDFLTKDAQQLAVATKTSGASVVRFCQQNGYEGIRDFKIALAQSLPRKEQRVDTILTPSEQPAELIQKLTQFVLEDTRQTAKMIDLHLYQAAVEALRNAAHVYLEGVSASSLPAQDLYYKLVRAGKIAYFDQDTHLALVRSYYTQPDDVMVIFSYSGLTKEVLLAGQRAKKNGTKLIVITRMGVSPLMTLGDFVIGLPATEKLLRVGAVSSLFSEMFVSSLLFLGMINQNADWFSQIYRDTEDLTNQLKEKGRKKTNGD